MKTQEELEIVIDVMNRNLAKVFGAAAAMKPGTTEVKTTMGIKDDGTVN